MIKEAEKVERIFQERLNFLTSEKSKKHQKNKKSALQIAKDLSEIKVKALREPKNYENLLALLAELDIEIEEGSDLEALLDLIDERFIVNASKNRAGYYQLLNELKQSYLDKDNE